MWADNETSVDLLGFQVHADLLNNLVMDDSVLPVTIGVFGDWGGGKSSIMRMMEKHLNSVNDETVCLYFNSWVFEGYDDAKAALLDSILKVFADETRFSEDVIKKAKELFKSVNWMRMMGLGFKNIAFPLIMASVGGPAGIAAALSGSFVGGLSDKVANLFSREKKQDEQDFELEELINKPAEEKAMLVREFRDKFEEMLSATNIKRLIVLIDDLDRCSPERLIENLEAIKLFLNVPKTAFVIGADPRIVRHAIEYRYKARITSDEPTEADAKTESISNRFVKDYLEKLIQIPYYLPKLSDQEVETYVSLLFCERLLRGDNYKRVIDAFNTFRTSDRYGVFGLGEIQGRNLLSEQENEDLAKEAPLLISLAPVITEGLKGNPRQIKRFLNSFMLRSKLANVAKLPSFRVDILAKLMVLEYIEPELFRMLYEWQAIQQGEPKQIEELEACAASEDESNVPDQYKNSWSRNSALRWLRVEPKLADVDLRDYFWLSRDQLAGSISGASLISPKIKIEFRKLLEFGSLGILKKLASDLAEELTGPEQDVLLGMLEKEAIKRPENLKVHKVFFHLIGAGMTEALSRYKNTLNGISDHNEIPYSLHNDIRQVGSTRPEILTLTQAYKSGSRIRKALDTERTA